MPTSALPTSSDGSGLGAARLRVLEDAADEADAAERRAVLLVAEAAARRELAAAAGGGGAAAAPAPPEEKERAGGIDTHLKIMLKTFNF